MDKQAVASDGTRLPYQVSGSQGPWLVFSNGLGADAGIWSELRGYLGTSVRTLQWDYRGLYDDTAPSPLPGAGTVRQLADDMLTILDTEGVRDAVWFGWSLGAQVSIEALQRARHRPRALVLVAPCYGRQTSLRSPWRNATPVLLETLRSTRNFWEPLVQRAANWPETPSWIKRLGLVASTADVDRLAAAIKRMGHVRWDRYLQLLRTVSTHRVDGTLPSIDVPTLAILPGRDRVTPLSHSEPLTRQIPDVEVFVIRQATHFVLLEYPELINLRVEKFLRERNLLH